jgi:hypothetical protein
MSIIIYNTGSAGTSFDEMVPQGQPIVENTNPDNLSETTIRQLYMCKMSAYRRPASGSLCPVEISPRIRAIFDKDGPRQWTGIGDIITFERFWVK